MTAKSPSPLFRQQELAFRTQYAELKERTGIAGPLLAGSPGTLALRSGTGYGYWYRVYYPVPGKQSEELVCRDGDMETLATMRDRIAFADWAAQQVSALRKLGFQTADKLSARVLVELHNRAAFAAGLVLVGTLGVMAWLNELGAVVVGARTQDIDLARRHPLELATPLSFMHTMLATELPFVAVPALSSTGPSTSVKLPGAQGLRVDMLAPGEILGAPVRVPELQWFAQAVPHYDYLLEAPEPAALLAGGHCVPVRLPQAARLVWHKLYASTCRQGFPEKALKDRRQALVLAAALVEAEPDLLARAMRDAPPAMIAPVRALAGSLIAGSAGHPLLAETFRQCLAPAERR